MSIRSVTSISISNFAFQIDAINYYCSGAATLKRLVLVGFDNRHEHFRKFKHGTMDLEHLSTGNKTIKLRLSTSLSAKD